MEWHFFCLPSTVHLAYACSAGTLGYHSLREMLQSGIPGTALLLESGDLRDVAVFPRPFLFLHTKDSVNKITVPHHVSHVRVLSNMADLPIPLLCDTTTIKTIDLSLLSHLKELPRYFLSGCTSLMTLDLSPLHNLTEIPSSFVSQCPNLRSINFSGLSNVKSLPADFLSDCTGLQELDLSPLTSLSEIKRVVMDMGCEDFMKGCSHLQEFNLTAFSRLKTLPSSLLFDWVRLTNIDLTPLS